MPKPHGNDNRKPLSRQCPRPGETTRHEEHAGRFRGISTKSRRWPLKSLPMQVRLGSSESTPGIILYLFRAGSLDWTSFAPPRPAIMVCFAIETHAIDQANAQPRTRSATAVGWRCPLRSSLIAVPRRVLRAMDPAGFSPLEQIDNDLIALARTGSTRNPARQVIALAGGVMARFCGPSPSREPARTICALRWPS